MATTAFTTTGQSAGVPMHRKASVLIVSKSDGGVGTVVIERSFNRHAVATDAAAVWVPYSKNTDGDDASYAVSGNSDVGFNGFIDEPARNVYYRFNCTSHSSGTVYAVIASETIPAGDGPQ